MTPEPLAQIANVIMLAASAAALGVALYAYWLLAHRGLSFDCGRWYFQRPPDAPRSQIELSVQPARADAQISILAALVAGFALALLLRELLDGRES